MEIPSINYYINQREILYFTPLTARFVCISKVTRKHNYASDPISLNYVFL